MLDTGEKEEKPMKKEITYTDEPLGRFKIVRDFLPSPEELVFREDNIKVTISLSERSVNFFKTVAKKNHTQYQKMIRRLLDLYVDQYDETSLTPNSSVRGIPRR